MQFFPLSTFHPWLESGAAKPADEGQSAVLCLESPVMEPDRPRFQYRLRLPLAAVILKKGPHLSEPRVPPWKMRTLPCGTMIRLMAQGEEKSRRKTLQGCKCLLCPQGQLAGMAPILCPSLCPCPLPCSFAMPSLLCVGGTSLLFFFK